MLRKRSMLKKGIIVAAAAICLSTGLSNVPVINENVSVVEAKKKKKDKKKPVIKISGESSITVEKNKSVKIPKTTAKDNKDGNVTKKLKVTVKKGKKSYSKIAKAIKSNKKVKFTSTGKYVITYTVTDKAKNKATKKRYITVVNKMENPSTTEEKTTETTTETPTTEAPTTEEPTMPDMSKYGTIEKVTVNGVQYNILNVTDAQKYSDDIEFSKQSKNISCDKMFVYILGYDSTKCDYSKNHKYLEFFGKIKVTDEYGVDCSNNIFIVEKQTSKKFYYINSKGEFRYISECAMVSFDFLKEFGTYNYIDEENKICINGEIFNSDL